LFGPIPNFKFLERGKILRLIPQGNNGRPDLTDIGELPQRGLTIMGP